MPDIPEGRIEAVLVDAMAKIEEYGFMVTGVFATADTEPGFVPFVYTAGLSRLALPEIIVMGLPMQVGHELINLAADGAIKRPYTIGDDYEGIAQGVKMRFIDAPIDKLGMARQLYPQVSAIQMLWPDDEGLFPTDPGFSETLKPHQPVLRG